MKKTLYTVAAITAISTAPALAGSPADAVVTPVEIIETTTSSSSGTALVAMLALLMALPVLD